MFIKSGSICVSYTKSMGFNFRILFCTHICIVLTASVTKPQFYALDNPCLERFRLCSTSCSVSYMTGSLNCQFCVCDDPRFSIAWPESTTPLPTTTTTTRPTLPDGQWMANNIIYTRLRHPCSEFYAACPLICKRANVTATNGTTCETCTCDGDALSILGKRDYPESFSIHKRQARKYHDHRKLGQVLRPCFHFGCPIFRCPEGLRFAISPSGCEECRCIPIDPVTTTATQISTTAAAGNENFIQMYCRKEPSDCPPGCSVVDFRVTDWHCYHCHCPNINYVALQKPCDQQNYLCSAQCTVRHLVNSKNQTDSCEFCDCTASARLGKGHPIFKRDINCPYHCPHYCRYDRKSSGTFGGPLGRRKRQTPGCNGDCSQCPYNNPPLDANFHTTAAPTPTKVHLPQIHFVKNCFQDESDFVDRNCVKKYAFLISGGPCHVCLLHNTAGQLVYLAHPRHVTDDNCFTSEYHEVLTHICKHVSEVHTSSDVCLLCHYKTHQNETIILPRFKLQAILQENHISIQQTGTLNTQKATSFKPHIETSTRPIPMTTKHLPTNERTTHKTTAEPIIKKPTTVVTSRITTPTSTTTTATTSAITTTSSTTSTTTTTTRSTTSAPPMCHTCSNVTCSSADLQECNTGSEYCMNTMTQRRDGSRSITRGCVSENECYNKWWIVSADNPSCLSKTNTPTGTPGQPIECHFCCKGRGCNQLMRIPDSLLYTGEDHPSNAVGGIIQIG